MADNTTTPQDGWPSNRSTLPNNGVGTDQYTSPKQAAVLPPSDFFPRLPSSADKTILHPPTLAGDEGRATRGDDASVKDAASTAPTAVVQAQIDAHGRTLNPRSCVTCRARKVKCDKVHPCSNCNRAHIECIFPAPGRAPRKRKVVGSGREKDLLERLRRLEGAVSGLGVDVLGKDGGDKNIVAEQPEPPLLGGSARSDAQCEPSGARGRRDTEHEFRDKTTWVEEQTKGRFENTFGRLVVSEGKSRYINNSFWANLNNEVEDLKGILNQSSDEETSTPPGSSTSIPSNHHGFVFGFSSQNADLLSLHPLPGQISEYWEMFVDRVDPLVKVLHIPSLGPHVLSAASHLSQLSKGFECLLFAVYYGATTSLTAHDCLLKLGEEKSVLLARYRFAIEQALARANFLTTEEMVVLQAFVIFLICLRRNNDARVIWTLTGLVVRIAQTIGIHRDGSHFHLSPFEVEMRRRLWWQVCILDTRASEDHGCDPTIVEQSFDTKMPLNINDEDIWPGIKDFPAERMGCTVNTFCLLRYEVANTFRRLNYIPPGPPKACTEFFSSVTLQDKERWILECHQKLEERYLKNCDMQVPLYWVTATVARLMMSKMWLMVYHPIWQNEGASLSEEVKKKLFITSLENMEYSWLLETDAKTKKWGWLFKTYVQWHALAFTLSELRHRTTGPLVERAWSAVEKTRYRSWEAKNTEDSNIGHLWRPLEKLYKKAKEARLRGLREEQQNQQRDSGPPSNKHATNESPIARYSEISQATPNFLGSEQLDRFTERSALGQTPFNKLDLQNSPKVWENSDEPMETTGLDSASTQQPFFLDLDQTPFNTMEMPPGDDGPSLAAPDAARAVPQLRSNFNRGPTSDIDFRNLESDAAFSSHIGQLHVDNDPSAMETSGDLDWENWDNLVRQFGMDVDSGMGTGSTTSWNSMNWETGASGQNLRMGMGMGGGDWF